MSNSKVSKNIFYILCFVFIIAIIFMVFQFFGSTADSSFEQNIFSLPFDESKCMISKVAFLLLVLFFFVIALRIGMFVLGWILSPSKSPQLIRGMADGRQTLVFHQDPVANDAITIFRSTDGLQFTWSVWIFLDDMQYLKGQYKHIFSKGNSDLDSNGMVYPNNAPGLYIAPNTNDLVVVMNTFDVINEHVVIEDIPLNKWVNVILRCNNRTFDVYINGTIAKSIKLQGVPKQNYGDVFVGLNGGFSGKISSLRYFDDALGITQIQSLVMRGASTKTPESDPLAQKDSRYLSMKWYFGEAGGIPMGFNPNSDS